MSKVKVVPCAKGRFIGFGIVLPIIMFIIFFTASLFATKSIQKDKEFLVETTATIVYIDVYTDTEYEYFDGKQTKVQSIEHVAYVDYVANGEQYRKVKLNYYSSNMRVGDEITICYDSRNPESIQSPTNIGLIFLIAISVFACLYTIIIVTVTTKKNRRINMLKEYGECHRVDIIGIVDQGLVEIDDSLEMEFCPSIIRLKVKYEDALYFSDEIKFTRKPAKNCTVNIYFDRGVANSNRKSRVKRFRKTTNKISGYYIDLNSIEKGIN